MNDYREVGLSGEMADRMSKLTHHYLDKVMDQFTAVCETKDDVFIAVISYFGTMLAHNPNPAMVTTCVINLLQNYENTQFEILKKEMNDEAE